ncbi:uncharacterized protein BJ212DRAFT_1299662 [Suillus subaureus]|uniref:DUF6532 domain-containing protein n=1 Tax=Suillus subaureus TaxID=48587 RepID=A0A9P7EB77_9AGAM|nr:uncharacterized protein BJ212DRAFT_1299662 [Suillus subaureus]KAG1816376.1 hypothetical protein BJ212DRAFT_1299662 [Suillus subaureus]
MHCKLKDDACTNVDGYFCLGHKDFAKVKTLMEKLVYIYAMKFDLNNNATPIRNRPYQGELLVLLISNQLFHSSRAIGMKFVSHFVEIAKNKSKHPKIPIPFLALVATAVVCLSLLGEYAAQLFIGLFHSFMEVAWFSREVYSYHIKSLKQLKHDTPGKFHYMMADTYEAAHKLKCNGATGDHIEVNAFELLDLGDKRRHAAQPPKTQAASQAQPKQVPSQVGVPSLPPSNLQSAVATTMPPLMPPPLASGPLAITDTPDDSKRQAGCWTRFWSCSCCTSTKASDGFH